jgi:hypothetical protein
MRVPRPALAASILGALVLVSAVSAGWSQPRGPRTDQPGVSAPMSPGMTRGPMMGAMPMGDMPAMPDLSQMMRACMQMMNQMMSGPPATPPAQPGPEGR